MNQRELWKLDATGQAALVREGSATAVDLVEAAIARIEALNPSINAMITPLYDLAREQMRGVDLGAPFAGVPILLKDASLEVEGTPYYLGTSVLRDLGYRSQRTTELAHRLRRAGFIFVGKTNCPELSAGITTEPRAFGPTRNPWDLSRSPGGSSGGSAAAVAAGMVSIAHGGDGTGSLRYPAACCGVVTLKPSLGLVPAEAPAAIPDDLQVWTEFVMARSVRDLAGVLDAVFSQPVHALSALGRTPRAMRVGILGRDAVSGMAVDPACVDAVAMAGWELAEAGHTVGKSLSGSPGRLGREDDAVFSSSGGSRTRRASTVARGTIRSPHNGARSGCRHLSRCVRRYSDSLRTDSGLVEQLRRPGHARDTAASLASRFG